MPLELNLDLTYSAPANLIVDSVLAISAAGDTGLVWDYVANPPLVFTKENFADWSLPENQDQITAGVAITRKDIQSFFNPITESGYNNPYNNPALSPAGTVWFFGNAAADTTPIDSWAPFIEAAGNSPPSVVGVPGKIYLPGDEIYLDFLLHSFSGGGTGGGFSYTRERIPAEWLMVERKNDHPEQSEVEYLSIHIDATELSAGYYKTAILITSNDTVSPEISVPITINVTGPDITTVIDIEPPREFMLYPNYPNPFNPLTTIRYNLPVADIVQVAIFNLQGQQIATLVNANQTAGSHTIQWPAIDRYGQPVSSGFYFYQLKTSRFLQTRKLLLLK
ncbi:MAG: T9SS type A sorting domain-containing protein [Candidatus Neomarinimicrobiota bacterium]